MRWDAGLGVLLLMLAGVLLLRCAEATYYDRRRTSYGNWFQKLKHGCVCRRPDTKESFDCLGHNHFVIKAKVMKSAESRDVIKPSVSYRPAAKYAVHIQHIFKDVSGSLKTGDNYVTANRSSFVCDTYLITGEEYLLKGKYVRGELRLGNMCKYGGQWDRIPRSRTNYLMARGICSLADRLNLPSGGHFKSKNETKSESPKIAPSLAKELKSKNEIKLDSPKKASNLLSELKAQNETKLVSSKKAPSSLSDLKSKNETKLEPPTKAPSLVGGLASKNETKMVSSKLAPEKTLQDIRFEKLKHGCVCRRPDTRESFDCLGHNHFVIKAKVMKSAESHDVIQPSVSYRPAAKYAVHIQHIFKDVSGSLKTGDNHVMANRSSFVCDSYLITGEEYLLKGKYVHGELRLGNMCEYGGQWDKIPRSRTNYLMSRGSCSLADKLQLPSGGQFKSKNERKSESPKIAQSSAKELKLKNEVKLDSPKKAPSSASEEKSKNETKLVSSKKAHKETLGEKGFEKLKHGCVCRRPDTKESFDCLRDNHFVIKAKVMKSAESRDVIQPSVSYRPAAIYPVHIKHIFKDVSGSLKTGDNYVTANRSSFVCDTYLITGEDYLLKGQYVRGELRLGNMCEYGGQWDRIPRSRTNYLMSRGTCSLADRLQLPSGGELKPKNERKLASPRKAPSLASELKPKNERKLASPKKAPSLASELKSKNERKLEPPKKAPSLPSKFKSKNKTKLGSSEMAPKKTLGDIRFQKLKHGCVCRRPDIRKSFDCLENNHFVIKAKVMKSAESRDVIQPSVSYRPAAKYAVHIQHIFKDVSGSLKKGDNYVTANRSSFVCDTYLITGEDYLLKGQYVRGELRLGNMCEYGGQWDRIPRSRTNYLMSRGTCSLADRLQLPSGGELKPKNERKLASPRKAPSLASELKSKNERKLEPHKKAPSLPSEFKSKNKTKLGSSEMAPKKTLGDIRFQKLKHGCVCRRPDIRKSFDCLENNHFVIKAKVMKSAESRDVIQPSVSYRPAAKYAVHIQHIFKDVSGSLKKGDNYVTANRSSFVCDTYLITGEEFLLKGKYVRGELRLGNMCEYGGQWDKIPRSRTNYLMSRGTCSIADRLQLPSGGEFYSKKETKLGSFEKAPSLTSELKPKNARKLEPAKKASSLVSGFVSKNKTKVTSSKMAPNKTLGEKEFEKLKHGCVCRLPDTKESFDCLRDNHFVIKAKVMKSAESRDVIQPSVSYRPAAIYAVHIEHIFKDVSRSLEKGDNYVTANRSSFVCDTYLITGEVYLLTGKYVRGELRLGNMCEYGGQWGRIPRSRTDYLMSRGTCSLADRRQLQSGGEFKSKKETKLDSPNKVSSSASELKSKNETKLVSPKKAPSSASELKSKNERNLEPPKKVPSLLGEFKSKNETKLVSSNMAPKKTSGDIRFQKLKHGCVCRRPDTRESFDCLGDNHFVIKAKVMKSAESRDVIQPSVSYRPAAIYPVHIQHIFKDVSGSLKTGDNYVTANRSSFVCDTYLITGEDYLLKGKYVRGELRLGNMCEYGGQWDKIPRSRTNYLMSRGSCSFADRLQLPSGGQFISKNETKLDSPKIVPSSASELKSKNERKLEPLKKAPSLASKLKATHETNLVSFKKAPSLASELKSKNETKLVSSKKAHEETLGEKGFEKLKHGCVCRRPDTRESFDCLGHNHFVIKAKVMKSAESRDVIKPSVSYRPAAIYPVHIQHIFKDVSGSLEAGDNNVTANRSSFVCDTYLITGEEYLLKGKYVRGELRLGNMCGYGGQWDRIPRSRTNYLMSRGTCSLADRLQLPSGGELKSNNERKLESPKIAPSSASELKSKNETKLEVPKKAPSLASKLKTTHETKLVPSKKAPSSRNKLKSKNETKLEPREKYPSLVREFKSKIETKLVSSEMVPSLAKELKLKNGIKLDSPKIAPSSASELKSKNETKLVSSKKAHKETLGEKGFEKLKHGCVCRRPDTRESFDCLGNNHFVIKAKVMKSAESRDVIQPSVSYRPAAKYPVHIQHIFKDVSGNLETGDNYVTANRSSVVCDTYLITGEEYLLKGKYVRGELRLGNMCEYGGQWDRIPRSRTNYLMSRGTCSLVGRLQLPSGGEFNSKNETKLELPKKAPSSVSKLKAKNEIKLEPAKKAPSLVSGFVSKNETKVTSSKMAPNKTLGEKGFQKLKHGCVCRRPDTKESFDCLGDSHFVIKAKVMKSAESRDVIQPSVSYRPAAIYPVHIEHIFKDVSGSLKTGDNYVTANRSSFVCDTYLITGEEYLLKGKYVGGELRLRNMCEYGGQWDRIPRSRTNYLMSRSTCSLADRLQLPSGGEFKSKKETKLDSPKKVSSSASKLKSKNERNLEPPKKVPSLLSEFKSKNETKLVSSNMAPKKTSGDIRFQKLKHGCVCRLPDTRESFDCLGNNHFVIKAKVMKSAESRDVIQPSVSYRPPAKYAVHIQHIFKDVSGSLKKGDNYVTANRSSFVCDTYLITGKEYLLKGKYVRGELRLGNMCEYGGQWDRIPRSRTNYLMSRGTCSLADRLQLPSSGEFISKNETQLTIPKLAPSLVSQFKTKNKTKLVSPIIAQSLVTKFKLKNKTKWEPSKNIPSFATKRKVQPLIWGR